MSAGRTIVDPQVGSGRTGSLWPRLRSALPYLLALGLFGLGLNALYRLLAPVNFTDVAAQIRMTPWTMLALAGLATLGGYLSLAGYDWSALRHIGKPLPIPVVLTGGLMAYAFGNTIGLTTVSGGAVRWRVYSGLGLDGNDVAAVSTFAAVSFGVAATMVGLGALAIRPGALGSILPFPPATIRVAAIVLTSGDGTAATVDLMRHSADAPPGTMEFLFTDLMLRLRSEGCAAFSLGMTPLSGLAPERSHRLWDRFGALIYRHGGNFYNFEGLRAFKDKFDPDWHPRYLAAPSALPPLLPLADAARLISGGIAGRQTAQG